MEAGDSGEQTLQLLFELVRGAAAAAEHAGGMQWPLTLLLGLATQQDTLAASVARQEQFIASLIAQPEQPSSSIDQTLTNYSPSSTVLSRQTESNASPGETETKKKTKKPLG